MYGRKDYMSWKYEEECGCGAKRQRNMFCLSDMKGLEEIGRGFYIKKGKVNWNVFWNIRG